MTGYLEAAGLMTPLETLGFALAGYGCTTCIGNSGPLDESVAHAVEENDLVVAAVLSGNRNFEGRIHPARARELPRLPAPRRRLRAGRPGRHRPDDRAARDRVRRTAGLPRRHLAGAGRDPRRSSPAPSTPNCSGGPTRPSSTATTLATAADPIGRPLCLGGRLDLHRQAPVLRGPGARAGAGRRHRGRAASWRSSAIR